MVFSGIFSSVFAIPQSGFVRLQDGEFSLDGNTRRFSGTNVYYLHYNDMLTADDVLQRAADMGASYVRMWAFLDIGLKNDTGSVSGGGGIKNGMDLT
jgi:mannan endo-1,4-beta-mannosidase